MQLTSHPVEPHLSQPDAAQLPSSSPDHTPVNEAEEEEAFFQSPGAGPSMLGFRLASFAKASSLHGDSADSFPDDKPEFATASLGFSTASAKSMLMPSAAALAKAEQRRKQWEEEDSTLSNADDDTSEVMLPPPPPPPPGPLSGFSKASSKGLLVPSTAAFAKAQQQRDEWERDVDEHEASSNDDTLVVTEVPTTLTVASSGKVGPSFQTPLKASASSGFSTAGAATQGGTSSYSTMRPPFSQNGFSTPARRTLVTEPLFITPVAAGPVKAKAKPFKSPLLPTAVKPSISGHIGSPLNPYRPSVAAEASNSRSTHTLSSTLIVPSTPGFTTSLTRPLSTPVRATPQRPMASLGITPRRNATPASGKTKFMTPFKPGMAPGEPGRTRLHQETPRLHQPSQRNYLRRTPSPTKRVAKTKVKEFTKGRFFDLSSYLCLTERRQLLIPPPYIAPVTSRSTLRSSGLVPQSYALDELEDMGM